MHWLKKKKMKQDNALKKVLEAREKGDLPYGFESRMMNKVMLEALRKRKRINFLAFSLVSVVSLFLIVGTIFLLKYYFQIDLSTSENPIKFSPESYAIFGFYFYIAFLVLILLGMDAFFRSLKHKSEKS